MPVGLVYSKNPPTIQTTVLRLPEGLRCFGKLTAKPRRLRPVDGEGRGIDRHAVQRSRRFVRDVPLPDILADFVDRPLPSGTEATAATADITEDQRQQFLIAASCPCCGAGGLSLSLSLKPGAAVHF